MNPFDKKTTDKPAQGDAMNPFDKKTTDKPDEQAAAADLTGQVEATLDAAEKAGSLAPLQKVVDDLGLDCTARDLFKYAQDEPETHGKSPDELAKMLMEDDGLVDDILAAKDKDSRKAEGADEGAESYSDAMKRVIDAMKRVMTKKPKKSEESEEDDEDEDMM